jgi:hypothetical protein
MAVSINAMLFSHNEVTGDRNLVVLDPYEIWFGESIARLLPPLVSIRS